MAYATIALSELVLVFAIRTPTLPAWRAGRNPWLFVGVAASVVVVAASVYVPPLREACKTVSLGVGDALAVLALSLCPFVAVEAAKAARRLRLRR
jgi:magnesium-transporting ATPase (P-type)